MTPDEAMKFFCAYHGVAARIDLLDRFGLAAKRNTQFHELSTGQQRRRARPVDFADSGLDHRYASSYCVAGNHLHRAAFI